MGPSGTPAALTACIFDIQRMSLHDGPGIRTNVFFKGCNLRCYWCHNPESWSGKPQLQFFAAKCIGCGACVPACPLGLHGIDDGGVHTLRRDACTDCGACAAVCPAGSLVLTGRRMTVDEVLSEVKKDLPFYHRSGGGVTLTGGEPLLQGDFAAALLKRLREERIHTAVETALHVDWGIVEGILCDTDFFLVDLKLMDCAGHREATGVPNDRILANIRRLDAAGARYCLRIPLIPTVNDSERAVGEMAAFIGELRAPEYVEFMPYHPLGEAKYPSLGMTGRTDGYKAPSKERMAELAALLGERVPVKY